jgi:hypothetical protein
MEKENKPIEVGQILYREVFKRNQPTEIEDVTVERIGKKYFYLEGNWSEKYPFDKETLQYSDKVYSQSNIQLYRTKQEILDRREFYELQIILRKHFDWSVNSNKNTLDQLRQVAEILGLTNQLNP